MTFNEYLEYCAKNRDFDQRLGQWMMNVLFTHHHALYSRLIQFPYLDPFYDDNNIPAFLTFLGYNWEGSDEENI